VVARGLQHDDAQPAAAQGRRRVLLGREALVDGHERVEAGRGEPEQVAVLRACPAGLGHRGDRVAGEVALEPAGEALVEEDAHRAGTR
jgi:hypothetical protein